MPSAPSVCTHSPFIGSVMSHSWSASEHCGLNGGLLLMHDIYVMPRQDGLFPCELHEWASLRARGKPMRDMDSKRVSFVESERRPIDELRAAKVSANQRPSRV